MQVIGFTGMPGSGKSVAMDVARARGYPVVRMGDLIWEEVARRGLPLEATEVGRIANLLREEEGPDVWALRTVARIHETAKEAATILIDGIRSNHEVEVFRRELGAAFHLVAIHTDPHHRYERMAARGRKDDSKDVMILRARDDRELGWGIARTIALADEMLVNDSTIEAFQLRVADLLDRLDPPQSTPQ